MGHATEQIDERRDAAPGASEGQGAAGPGNRVGAPAVLLLQAAVFGFAFGFLLQKGGVAKYHVLIGVLLLEDFTVIKVMLSAIVTGMVGVYLLGRLGVLEPKVKETVYGANILGGLIFGVGFGLIAYCPGTNAAAVGQGNYDAIVGILGMVVGSYLFALSSKVSSGTVSTWGKRGKITLPELLRVPRGAFVAGAAMALVLVLVLLERFTTR